MNFKIVYLTITLFLYLPLLISANASTIKMVTKHGPTAVKKIIKFIKNNDRHESEEKLMKKINELHRKINNIEEIGRDSQIILESNFKKFILGHEHTWTSVNSIWDRLIMIHIQHKHFLRYINASKTYEKNILLDFATQTISHDSNSVMNILEYIHEIILPEADGGLRKSLFDNLADYFKENTEDMCYWKQSPHQFMYHLYNSIVLSELKGFAMVQFSYMILNIYDQGNYTEQYEALNLRYKQRAEALVNKLKSVIDKVDGREIKTCDPVKHIEGETYLQLTGLLQGYIENIVNLGSSGSCKPKCTDFTLTKAQRCMKGTICEKQNRCNGKVISCTFFDSDMWICPSSSKLRRYDYIEYENGQVLGTKEKCAKGTTKVDSWWRFIHHCIYCFCLCEDVGIKSDRFFNLRDVKSDIENNRVVTGLRFVKHNRIIHLQIQEGELLSEANINKTTVEWIPPEHYNVIDKHVKNGKDYLALERTNRAIDLDDVEAPDGYVITGIRFRVINSHLKLEARVTRVNLTSGTINLHIEDTYWIRTNKHSAGKKHEPKSPDVPTKLPAPSTQIIQNGYYVDFTHSDVVKDAAQTVIPFIDAQPVSPSIPMALGGVGLLYRGYPGYGGFIAPKLMNVNLGQYIETISLLI